ncbi:MAG: hypothetical protein KIT25_03605 [Enhydrobacter sp.]|nr:MAG: hypothetical protein KIT25_03605 [Enhydrobacter sp.]
MAAKTTLNSHGQYDDLALDNATPDRRGHPQWDWEDMRIDVLDALERSDEAQMARWSCFERALSVRHLRDYLKRLPDFDDVRTEEQALTYAESHGSLLAAPSFLVAWPDLERAARTVGRRARELDGDHYEILTPAANALAGKFPLAATLVLRSMIDFAVDRARSGRYRHAARHLLDCSGLAASVEDWESFETHEAYIARLRNKHARKTSFWAEVE